MNADRRTIRLHGVQVVAGGSVKVCQPREGRPADEHVRPASRIFANFMVDAFVSLGRSSWIEDVVYILKARHQDVLWGIRETAMAQEPHRTTKKGGARDITRAATFDLAVVAAGWLGFVTLVTAMLGWHPF
jgi:hypothetical protein